MKTLLALLLMTGSALGCPFASGTTVVTPEGVKGIVTEALSSGADAHESATVKFEDGTTKYYFNQPGVDAGDSDLCALRKTD